MRFFNRYNRNALFIILEGIAFTAIFNLYNPFIQMFAKRMGAGDIHVALINSLPPLVAIFVLIPCGILIEKINKKKQTTLFLIFLNSLFYAAIAFVPFIQDKVKVIIYVVLIGLMNLPGSLYQTTWQSFYADTFRGTDANRVFSLRSKYGAFIGLLTVLVSGWMLTDIPRSEAGRLIVYQFFYAACFAISLLQLLFLSRVKKREEPDIEDPGKQLATFRLKDFKEIFRNRKFTVYSLCAFIFHIGWQTGWPLFFLYYADYAKLNEFQFGLMNLTAGIAAFLSYSLWNRLLERRGTRFTIIFGVLGLTLSPYLFTMQLSFTVIIIINLSVGLALACFNLTLFCGLLETLPENRKTVYISVFNTMMNISGFISPLAGIWLYGRMSIYQAMLVIALLRTVALVLYTVRWWSGRSKIKLDAINKNLEV